jgi:epoxide hydrolase-like predicted phosphatase
MVLGDRLMVGHVPLEDVILVRIQVSQQLIYIINMIKAIAFDYGGVIELTEGDLFKEITQYLNVARENWDKVYFSLNHLNMVKKGEEVLALVAKEFHASDTQISYIKNLTIEHSKKGKKINEELINIIKKLKKKNYKIALLSNNSVELRQRLTDQNIIDLFDTVVISSEVGHQKPKPEIFNVLFNKLEVNSNEVIFIDDTKQSLFNASSIGYTPILYIDNQKLEEELSKIL